VSDFPDTRFLLHFAVIIIEVTKPSGVGQMAIKKGGLVRVQRERLENSLEAQANDTRWPAYLFAEPAEVLEMRGDYVQLKFRVPTPPIWLRTDQVEECP
jgi:hypothetical protein